MSKEEFVKIKVCDLRVNIHCDGCKREVQKILRKIDGVYKITIDSEQGKVTVGGDFDPDILIRKLTKHGKRAELWDAPKSNATSDQDQQAIVKNIQLDNGKEGKKGPAPVQKAGTNQQQLPPNGAQQQVPSQQAPSQPQMPRVPDQQQAQQAPDPQQRQQLKMPPQMNIPSGAGPKPILQAAKGGDLSADDSEEYDSEDEEPDEDDVLLLPPQLNKMKPVMRNGQGGAQMPPGINLGQQLPPQMLKAAPLGNGAPSEAKKGGNGGAANQNPGAVGGQRNAGSAGDGSGAKKGDGAGGDAGGGSQRKNGGAGQTKNGGAGQTKNGGAGQTKNGGGGGAGGGGGEKVVIDDAVHLLPSMMGMGGGAGGIAGQMGSFRPQNQRGQMVNRPVEQRGQMGPTAAVQGVPAAVPGGRNFPEAGPEAMQLNAYHQRMAAMMMNQRGGASYNGGFQPTMYARPPPEVTYMPPAYQQTAPHPEPFTNYFSEENPTSCSIM